MPTRIHILGASGTGATTLTAALAAHLHIPHHDTDTFLWLPTSPPFQSIRPTPDRLALLAAALDASENWLLSGSLSGWGDPLVPRFTLVIFLSLPPALRLDRLRQRERQRYGDPALAPGGSHHQQSLDFLAWAASYDTSTSLTQRTRAHHTAWLAALPCPTLHLEIDLTTEQRIQIVLNALAAPSPASSAAAPPTPAGRTTPAPAQS